MVGFFLVVEDDEIVMWLVVGFVFKVSVMVKLGKLREMFVEEVLGYV